MFTRQTSKITLEIRIKDFIMNFSAKTKEEMKERLKRNAKRKFQTSFIFPLSQFELEFGDLWGFRLPEDELTSEQKENRKRWSLLRQRVLDTGNQQIRNFFAELDTHEVIWNRYKTEFLIKENV